ncbi:MAG: hypothetical protein EZS28_011540 [Streblomastix strix]|uniref:Uncharacterized protein n=1 Tax=Streblomastix strix TaxID=222440 RepID=A0A5J4WF29_9EUKA|nr:MAG: hypothetical protein EZS28_011540 [Streblomastix strix]
MNPRYGRGQLNGLMGWQVVCEWKHPNIAVQIDMSWDFGSGTGEREEDFKDDFIDEARYLESKSLDKEFEETHSQKTLKKLEKPRCNKSQTQWYYNNQVWDSQFGPLFGQTSYS